MVNRQYQSNTKDANKTVKCHVHRIQQDITYYYLSDYLLLFK